MNEHDPALPSREEIMSVIGTLEKLGPAMTEASQQAEQVRRDEDVAALQAMTAERDAWKAHAESLQEELVLRMEAIRVAAGQQLDAMTVMQGELQLQREQLQLARADGHARDEQIAQLRDAITVLTGLVRTRLETPAAAPARPVSTTAAARAAAQALEADLAGPQSATADAAPMEIPSLAPDRQPSGDQRRLGVGRVRLVDRPMPVQHRQAS